MIKYQTVDTADQLHLAWKLKTAFFCIISSHWPITPSCVCVAFSVEAASGRSNTSSPTPSIWPGRSRSTSSWRAERWCSPSRVSSSPTHRYSHLEIGSVSPQDFKPQRVYVWFIWYHSGAQEHEVGPSSWLAIHHRGGEHYCADCCWSRTTSWTGTDIPLYPIVISSVTILLHWLYFVTMELKTSRCQ